MSDIDFSSDDFDKLLDDFIANQLNDIESDIANNFDEKNNTKNTEDSEEISDDELLPQNNSETFNFEEYVQDFSIQAQNLATEERKLFDALINLIKSSICCAKETDVEINKFDVNIEDIIPRFNPQRIENITQNILQCWELLIKSQPERLANLPINPSDEQILNYAEKTTNKNLMMALISYVECLIEMDSCEIAYNLRKVKYKKYKIEKKIYEEEMHRKEKIRLYIKAIKEKNFPIDADLLINNFFKAIRKDPEAAKKIIEKNPATFAPIQIDKLPNKFFGMIKAKPEDGIKINKKIGKFIKNLKI